MKISWNVHDEWTPWHSGWQLNCQICLFMFIAVVNLISTSWMHLYQINLLSNKEFQISQYFYCSWAYDTIHKFLNKMFKSFVDSFGSWCIIASFTSVIRWHQWEDVPVALVRSITDFQIFNDLETSRKQVNCIWNFEIAVKTLLRYGFKCSLFSLSTQMI